MKKLSYRFILSLMLITGLVQIASGKKVLASVDSDELDEKKEDIEQDDNPIILDFGNGYNFNNNLNNTSNLSFGVKDESETTQNINNNNNAGEDSEEETPKDDVINKQVKKNNDTGNNDDNGTTGTKTSKKSYTFTEKASVVIIVVCIAGAFYLILNKEPSSKKATKGKSTDRQ